MKRISSQFLGRSHVHTLPRLRFYLKVGGL